MTVFITAPFLDSFIQSLTYFCAADAGCRGITASPPPTARIMLLGEVRDWFNLEKISNIEFPK